MKMKSGTTRKVLILWIFAIKYPKIIWRDGIIHEPCAGKIIISSGQKTRWKARLRRLLLGMKSNWAEYIFYWKHRLPILMPTYFSLFGLLNIQLAGQETGFSSEVDLSLYQQISKICESDIEIHNDIHVFGCIDNFCRSGDRLIIVDYAGSKTQNILQKWGDRIFEKFDFDLLS